MTTKYRLKKDGEISKTTDARLAELCSENGYEVNAVTYKQ